MIQENAIVPIQFKVVDDNGQAINISTATELKLICLKPNGVEVSFAAAFATNGADGVIQYLTQDGDLKPPGTWRVQASYKVAPNESRTSVDTFPVSPNL